MNNVMEMFDKSPKYPKKKIRGTIRYTMDKYHPDYSCTLPVKDRDKVQEFSDTYMFDVNNPRSMQYGATMENMISYMKHDLMLVAGGGYTTAHIHNISFEFKEV